MVCASQALRLVPPSAAYYLSCPDGRMTQCAGMRTTTTVLSMFPPIELSGISNHQLTSHGSAYERFKVGPLCVVRITLFSHIRASPASLGNRRLDRFLNLAKLHDEECVAGLSQLSSSCPCSPPLNSCLVLMTANRCSYIPPGNSFTSVSPSSS